MIDIQDKKWSMDLLKSAIIWLVGPIFSLLILNKCEENRAEQKFKRETVFKLGLDNLETFKEVTAALHIAALDAHPYLTDSENQLIYKDKTFDQYNRVMEDFMARFCDSASLPFFHEMAKKADRLHTAQDLMFNFLTKPDLAGSEFRNARQEFKNLRKRMINNVEKAIIIGEPLDLESTSQKL